MRPLVLLIGLSVLATQLRSQVTVGHRMGIALTKWSINEGSDQGSAHWSGDQSWLPGFFFEVPVEVPLSSRLILQSGLGFVQKGYRFNDGKQQFRTGYMQAPLSIGFKLDKGRYRIAPSLGAAFAANMRGYYQHDFNDQGSWSCLPIGRTDELGFTFSMPDLEWSMLARLCMSYRLKRSRVEVDFGYQHGLSNAAVYYVDPFADLVDPEGGAESPFPHQAFQRTLTVSIGYSLELGKRETLSQDSATIVEANDPTRVSIGQRIGASSASMLFKASLPEEQERVVDGAAPLPGLATALVVNVLLNENFSLQPELGYTQRGWRCQWYPRPTARNDLLRMNYLELPVLVRYAYGKGEIRPFAIAGPVFAKGVGGHDIIYRGEMNNGQELAYSWPMSFGDDPEQGQYASFDMAYLLGVGVSWKLERSELFLDLRYQYSTSDFVVEGNPLLYSEEVEAHHRVWLLSAGYLIPW